MSSSCRQGYVAVPRGRQSQGATWPTPSPFSKAARSSARVPLACSASLSAPRKEETKRNELELEFNDFEISKKREQRSVPRHKLARFLARFYSWKNSGI